MSTNQATFIVGIGASAGGLHALEALFRGLPDDTGMAFVVVTHLPRGRKSVLASILGRSTKMSVVAAETGTAVKPNHVYVAQPGNPLIVKAGSLDHGEERSEFKHHPIDQFLLSLAEEAGDAAIGILLSGGGFDGTLGMRAIRDHGGLTIAQGHNGSAPQQSSMPDSAIAAGVVELILTAEEIGPRLAEFARSPIASVPAKVDVADVTGVALRNLSATLLDRLGHDFSGYKPKTFMRRARRRMQILHLTSFDDYATRLREDADEAPRLFRSLLIGVTSFFRDAAAFEALEKTVISRLVEGKGANDTIRVWVPGCATGEEAYSIAILLREHMDKLRIEPRIQIFATDIDDQATAVARAGRYQAPALGNVSPERLNRFFTADDVGYTVVKGIRDMCVFSTHNILHHAPFSRLDLISCRNVLIYFGAAFQARVLPVFHFALRPHGFLFLGASENVSQNGDLFMPLDKKSRIFQRRDQAAPAIQITQYRFGHAGDGATAAPSERAIAGLRTQVEGRVLERFAPAHVVVNRDGDVVYYSSRTGKYLEPAAGPPNRQLLAMARRGLRVDLRAALRDALQTMKPVLRERLSFDLDGRLQLVNVVVEPFGGSENDPLFLLLFQDVGNEPVTVPGRANEANDETMARLEQDLREGRDRLQATIEEYETAVEELKSSNEELQSINEEMQSTNEELETSKEELQAVNEELSTVNAELNARFEDLDRASADLRNVYDATSVAIVFLDERMVIRSFTPAATDIFKLIASDVGRPLADIVSNLADAGDLQGDLRTTYERGGAIERRVGHKDGRRHFFMRLVPYRGPKMAVNGVLASFVDVTALVDAEKRHLGLLQELNKRVRSILRVIAGLGGESLTASPKQFADTFAGRIRSLAMSYDLLAQANWGDVALSEILEGELAQHRKRMKARLSIKGPSVSFPPPQTLALGMAFHELARHAEARGVLSGGAKARLSVSWEITDERKRVLKIEWRETRGTEPPTRGKKPQGPKFPSKLVAGELKVALRASIAFAYEPDGVRTCITIPFGDLA